MISLTRLKGETFLLNVAMIEQVEAFPDTTVTLSNGKKIVVQESIEDVRQLTTAFYRRIGLIGLSAKEGDD
ncbi:flagellar FlbD family protein [Salibacterium halotolerans]|uniref:flagellar FlbD family protein n=1 Tax=Salibacterium halotolerans TaxID=1884432 RepID=UPI000B84D5BD|nr:flagellar FlbD family protein [Salibacterium halotolerans]